ncbi:hypothetical protein VRY85_14865, partial [Achromobacter sp. F4_2707]|uniref:hypothetical protein n=1 Tax=Achromobacter sp. F4_2707 TaxID=3114286 RepID=UPI0039C6DD02
QAVTVNESGLVDGDPKAGGEFALVTIPTGFEFAGVVTQGTYGEVRDVDGQLTYVLTSTHTHTGTGTDEAANADTVTLLVKDAVGNTFEVEMKVNIVDDIPTLDIGDPLSVVAGNSTDATAAGSFTFDFGADADGGAKSFTLNGAAFTAPTE